MNYQEFKDYIVEHVKDYLSEKYQKANVEITEIHKNNNFKLDALTIFLPEENNMSEHLYERFLRTL